MSDWGVKKRDALREAFLARANIKSLIAIVAISLVAALFYTPPGARLDYAPGEVSLVDVHSPVSVDSVELSVRKGEVLLKAGVPAGEYEEARLKVVKAAMGDESFLLSAAGIFFLTFILLSISYVFAVENMRKGSFKPRDLLFTASLFTVMLFFIWFASLTARSMAPVIAIIPAELYIYLIPVAVGPMLVMLFLNAEAAFVFAAVLSIIASFFLGSGFESVAYFFIGSVAASLGVRYTTQRSTVIKAGGILGAVNAATLLTLFAAKPGFASTGPLFLVPVGLFSGLVTAIIAVGVAPVIESIFRYKTGIKLLELSRMDHPLLRKLAVDAPGTYHHSIVMGSLVESAAEAIGANSLLARVSAYYHDIGKSKKPLYFIENMRGDNKHDKLNASMSALIILNHIKEGVELAKKHRLGSEITDVIKEHHGTTLMRFFYEKAKREAEGVGAEPSEVEFRYAGPKPQTKESGLVMLADACEAASKTLPDPSPAVVQGMTQKIINRFFTDGQLDECELTLKDLHLIGESFNRVFTGIFHQRIDYPEPAYIDGREDGVKGARRGPDKEGKEGEDKEGGREGLKRLGIK